MAESPTVLAPPVVEEVKNPMQSVLSKLEVVGGFGENHTPIDHLLPPEKAEVLSHKPKIITPFLDFQFIKELKDAEVLPPDFPDEYKDLDTDEDFQSAGIELIAFGSEITSLDSAKEDYNSPVIVYVPDEDTLKQNTFIYKDVNDAFWKIPASKRPPVILFSKNFKLPLFYKRQFEGFLFASDLEDLQSALQIANELISTRESQTFNPSELEPLQEQSYDESLDLREWEHKTADTYQTLKLLFENINRRNKLDYSRAFPQQSKGENSQSEKVSNPPAVVPYKGRYIENILDLGCGEGRISQIFARLGFNVVGLDISQGMLDRGEQRLREEGEGLTGVKEHPGLSYEALLRLKQEGLLPQDRSRKKQREIILDDQETANHYITMKGSFFNPYFEVKDAIRKWLQRGSMNGKAIGARDFFNDDFYQKHELADGVFDKVICTWNTLWEIGDKKNQEKVINQLYWLLQYDGDVTVEIADRTTGPYPHAIEQYHEEHPDEPLGTIKDKKPDGKGEYPKRYLSDINELADMFRAVGFEVHYDNKDLEDDNPDSDVRLYYLNNDDPSQDSNQQKVRVYQITAHKK